MIAVTETRSAPAATRRSAATPTELTSAEVVLAIGRFSNAERSALASAVATAGATLRCVESVGRARRWLHDHTAHAIVLSPATPGSRGFALHLRRRPKTACTPLFTGCLTAPTDLVFENTFDSGADDVIDLDHPQALVRRLRAVRAHSSDPQRGRRSLAVVATEDAERAAAIAFALYRNAYRVEIADSRASFLELAATARPELVIADSALGLSSADLADVATDGYRLLTAAPKELAAAREQFHGVERTAVVDAFVSADALVFAANDLKQPGADRRASARVFYGSMVGFRPAGGERDDYGFTYNVSRAGMYVRTVSIPDDDQVWLEVTPPRTDRKVRLEGRVVWRRPFGPSAGATTPAGFGVEITDGSVESRRAWEQGYERFLQAFGLGVSVSAPGELDGADENSDASRCS